MRRSRCEPVLAAAFLMGYQHSGGGEKQVSDLRSRIVLLGTDAHLLFHAYNTGIQPATGCTGGNGDDEKRATYLCGW